ncbi:hypothetical protein HK405_009063, partial [Cladochytrium tenue]
MARPTASSYGSDSTQLLFDAAPMGVAAADLEASFPAAASATASASHPTVSGSIAPAADQQQQPQQNAAVA